MLTVGSLFSGIGGIDLAFVLAGFDIRWQVEIDPYCQKVLQKHADDYWPHSTIATDVRHCTGKPGAGYLPYVDVMVGGFPCQDISTAGNGVGLSGARSGLWWEFHRLIGEIRPRAILLENVAAITYPGRGGTEVVAALAQLGYVGQWGIIRASDAGAPHTRKRWFCVAYAQGERCKEGWESYPATSQRIAISGKDVAYADCERYQQQATTCTGSDACHIIRHAEADWQQGADESRSVESDSEILVNAEQQRLSERNSSQSKSQAETIAGLVNRLERPGSREEQRQVEPRLGRDADGISCRVDGHRLMQHQWPTRPGMRQYPYEPPRNTTKTQGRAARIKALGNAVVPQVIYPIAMGMMQKLSEE